MRSRFEAFQRGDREWLLDTWHPDTRPATLELADNPTWIALTIVDTVDGGPFATTGVVEFEASFVVNGQPGTLRERSRFERVAGRWYYVDGIVDPS